MSDWLSGLYELNRRGRPAVLVTVVETRGSAPREPGTKMTVGEQEIQDTVGGGQLEHAVIESARLMLEQDPDVYANVVERHALSPSQGQCCGGVVRVLLERIPGRHQAWIEAMMDARRAQTPAFVVTPIGGTGEAKRVLQGPGDVARVLPAGDARSLAIRAIEGRKPVYDRKARLFVDSLAPMDFHVVLFGAGHVGKALAGVLSTLPCTITWVDSRADQFPGQSAANVSVRTARFPEALVDECPAGSYYVVTTHSHPLDFAICERILGRGDFAYCGMIGSTSKRRNLEKHLARKGITGPVLNRLTCPIGVPGISGKRPEEIAVAVAAELLQVRSLPSASLGSASRAGRER